MNAGSPDTPSINRKLSIDKFTAGQASRNVAENSNEQLTVQVFRCVAAVLSNHSDRTLLPHPSERTPCAEHSSDVRRRTQLHHRAGSATSLRTVHRLGHLGTDAGNHRHSTVRPTAA